MRGEDGSFHYLRHARWTNRLRYARWVQAWMLRALAELAESPVGRALVLDGDRLLGLLSITDLARALEVGGSRRRAA